MKEHYVTIFDSFFLPQGIALHSSLEAHAGDYFLWVICVDDEAYRILSLLGLPDLRPLKLSDVETPELLKVKQERTNREYCWTFTSFAPDFIFNADSNVNRVTYIDADLFFLKNPAPIFKEFNDSGKNVLITDHGYAPEYDRSATSGQYCVQFMTFNRHGGENVRRWWQDRCLEWCFDRFEEGKFGDQKYLDHWPELFKEDVHVLQNEHFALAPWNATRFPFSGGIFYHFQGFRILKNSVVDLAFYPLPAVLILGVYDKYIQKIDEACLLLAGVGFIIKPQRPRLGIWKLIRLYISGMYSQRWRFKVRNIIYIKTK